ncbi:MAG: hypothetical protein WC273_07830 [Dehalococcoidia bacterium]
MAYVFAYAVMSIPALSFVLVVYLSVTRQLRPVGQSRAERFLACAGVACWVAGSIWMVVSGPLLVPAWWGLASLLLLVRIPLARQRRRSEVQRTSN